MLYLFQYCIYNYLYSIVTMSIVLFHNKRQRENNVQTFSTPLSTTRVSNGTETRRCEGHSLRGCLWHGSCKSLSSEIVILLLAIVQSEPLRSQSGFGKIRKYVWRRYQESSHTFWNQKNTNLIDQQMTWHRSFVKETPARTQATPKLAKCVTIIGYPSRSLLRHRHPCISASNARTRYTGRIRIKCSTISCTPCNRCRWYAKTRWVSTLNKCF